MSASGAVQSAKPRQDISIGRLSLALRRLDHLPALALFLLVTLIMTWPYPRQIQTSLYNWSDALLNSWTLGWGVHALLTDPLNLYNANIFYPYQNTLAYSESLVPLTFLSMPVVLLTGMPAFAHNLLGLLSFVLGAFGMYLLFFDITRSRAGGLVAGVIFSFTSYKMMHFAHLQLLSSEWMPFALYFLRRLLSAAPRPAARRLRDAFLFALLFSFQALSSFYYAFFIAIAAGLYIAYQVIGDWLLVIGNFRRRNAKSTHRPPIAHYRSLITNYSFLLLSILLIALFTLPLALPYFSVQRELGLERGIQDAEYYAANLRTYFSVPAGNWLYHTLLAPKARLTGSGERDFVGIAAMVLGLLGLFARSRNEREKWFYFLLALAGVILSFGPRNEILLFPNWPKISLPFYLPYRWLYYNFPGFKAMRGPDRFAYLAVLGLAILAGYGAQAFVARLKQFRPQLSSAAPFASLVLIALIGLENVALPIRATNPATLARPVPAFAQYLSTVPRDSVVLEIPVVYDGESLTWPQYYSIYHWGRLVNGFSGFFPPGYMALAKLADQFPSEASLAVLDEIGVTQVIVHTDLLNKAQKAAVDQRVSAFSARIRSVHHSTTDDIYELIDPGRGWAADLAGLIPSGARVRLANSREDRRVMFEYATAFLPGRQFSGEAKAAYRPLAPMASPAEYILANSGDSAPAAATRIWGNEWLALYRAGPPS